MKWPNVYIFFIERPNIVLENHSYRELWWAFLKLRSSFELYKELEKLSFQHFHSGCDVSQHFKWMRFSFFFLRTRYWKHYVFKVGEPRNISAYASNLRIPESTYILYSVKVIDCLNLLWNHHIVPFITDYHLPFGCKYIRLGR